MEKYIKPECKIVEVKFVSCNGFSRYTTFPPEVKASLFGLARNTGMRKVCSSALPINPAKSASHNPA